MLLSHVLFVAGCASSFHPGKIEFHCRAAGFLPAAVQRFYEPGSVSNDHLRGDLGRFSNQKRGNVCFYHALLDALNPQPCPSVSQVFLAARSTYADPITATATPSAPMSTQTTHGLACTSTVVVTSLSFNSKEKEIREHFRAGLGADLVVKIRLQPDNDGCKAVVDFESPLAARSALVMHRSVLRKKAIGVALLSPPGLAASGEIHMRVYQSVVRKGSQTNPARPAGQNRDFNSVFMQRGE